MSAIWSFSPLDTSFFREARPFNAGEGGYLDSHFPPPMQTLIGAFRGAVGEAEGVDWEEYRKDEQHSLRRIIGSPEDFGPLTFGGPYLLQDGQRLYPVPLHLLCKVKKIDRDRRGRVEQTHYDWAWLQPGEKAHCDLGTVRLPEKVGKMEGGRSPNGAWLDQANLERVLKGKFPQRAYSQDELFVGEIRTGIARDNSTRTVEDGMLYFTRHIRLRDRISFGLGVSGLKEGITPAITRLGGEGRLAVLECVQEQTPEEPAPQGGEQGLILTLLTHGDFGGNWFPDELKKEKSDQKAIWKGLIKGHKDAAIHVEIVTACLGKAVREGGWDYKAKAPKPLVSLVPAGSSYFVKVKGDLNDAIDALRGTKIGNRTKFGYGEIAAGLWK